MKTRLVSVEGDKKCALKCFVTQPTFTWKKIFLRNISFDMYQIMHFVFSCLMHLVYLKNHKDWHYNHRIERPFFFVCYVIAEIHEIDERATCQVCILISNSSHDLFSRILTKVCDNFVQSGHGFKKLLIILSLQLHVHVLLAFFFYFYFLP